MLNETFSVIFKHRALVRTKNQVFGGDFPRRWVVGYCTLGGPYGAKFSRGTNNPGSEKVAWLLLRNPQLKNRCPTVHWNPPLVTMMSTHTSQTRFSVSQVPNLTLISANQIPSTSPPPWLRARHDLYFFFNRLSSRNLCPMLTENGLYMCHGHGTHKILFRDRSTLFHLF